MEKLWGVGCVIRITPPGVECTPNCLRVHLLSLHDTEEESYSAWAEAEQEAQRQAYKETSMTDIEKQAAGTERWPVVILHLPPKYFELTQRRGKTVQYEVYYPSYEPRLERVQRILTIPISTRNLRGSESKKYGKHGE